MMKLFLLLAISIQCCVASAQGLSTPIGKGTMPALARDRSGYIHLVYGSGDSLLYSVSTDKGKTFSRAQLIESVEGLAASATRGPQITISNNVPVVVATTNAGNIWSFQKNKKTWLRSNRLNDVDSVNLEGFVDVASDGSTNIFAVWLDLRGNKRNKLYGIRSSDGGKSWSANIKVYESPDSTICECCRVSVAMKGNKVHVMFRNQLYGQRDLYIISSSNGGRAYGQAEKLGTGSWKLNGCPMDGGGMVLTSEGRLQTVWRRESKIFSCEPGQHELEIGEGKSCTIESADGKNVYAWVANGEVICRLSNGMLKKLGKGNSPALLAIGSGQTLCVWENEHQLSSSVIQ